MVADTGSMGSEGTTVTKQAKSAVVEPEVETKRRTKPEQRPRKQPRYNVVLWDDDDHTYDYVIRMMRQLFGYSLERAYEIACEVDTVGRVVCLTTTLEHAELKRDQIHAFGKDPLIPRCKGSMYATIEPVEE
ncbi:MAG: ATP-dependent Clp protease ClpS [Pirellulaceae bacterium]|nr:MAG: ATP-dependent Clp protease ClpS [Pirellulaceae bacterium]